ncbi:oligoendopeptidase F [Halodesulfurarchaeum formicicum]|uniref:Oligoendopeptidase F n=1 Tax=Halodesulfurarchaeum formicicum TaxID=1873524 RepID=A0A1J1A903_9EURY|nr:oligoendopeptidase F [Halodesulfurarchaeum formicicum]APE94598.1 oligoendopeptidase F [Halodesulfurarchaeum formicicum]
MDSVPERAAIPTEYTWDLEAIYESTADWEAAFEAVSERIDEIRAYEGRLGEDGETLLAALQTRDELARELDQVAAYARMRSDEDTRDQAAQGRATRARTLAAEFNSANSFIGPEIQQLPESRVTELLDSTPELATYEHYLDDVLRLKPHTRSAEVEGVLSELGEVLSAPSEVFGKLTNADLTFPTVEGKEGEVEITQSNFTSLLQRPDREFRERVHEAFYGELATVRNTLGTSLNHQVRKHVKTADIRDYESAREAALDGSNVPVSVYDALVETVEGNLETLHRHLDLKATALGVDELEMYDVYAPAAPGESPEISYEAATEMVIEALSPLGEAYQDRVEAGIESRWIDVHENRGKRSGAYSGGTYDTHPYILMNWQDDVTSLYTLAHELGHSMHSELASEAQPYVDADYEIFVAEVASTVNETLLTHHLLETVEDEHFRAHVLDQFLERFRSTLYRQTLFAAFEAEIHERSAAGEPLTPDRLDELYGERKARYYAPAHLDEHIRTEWMRIPHFYYNFYVYQYATGLSAAVAIVDRIESDSAAATDYLDALRLGGSEYPLDVLQTAGVDMADSEPIETAIGEYERRIEEMADLLA